MLVIIFVSVIAVVGISVSLLLHGYLKNSAQLAGKRNTLLVKTKVLLCFAHPDDEVMFFSPTVLPLTGDGSQREVFFLCLSTGNYDGLGDIRKEELYKSSQKLGVNQENVKIIDHLELQDGPQETWNKELIARIVLDVVQEKHIETIVTFDDYGVSGHPNHIAVYNGVRHLMESSGRPQNLRAFQLESTGVLRKYLSLMDISLSVTLRPHLLCVSDWTQWTQAIVAMQQHRSQWVWFRRLYVVFSRYMLINTLLPLHTGQHRHKEEL